MNEDTKGVLHPLTILAEESYKVFTDLGFEVATGPEIETGWYCFDSLNFPKEHPARDMQDAFWIKNEDEKVLRTHTTTVSVKKLEEMAKNGQTEGAYISIGKVFRNESTDATHEMQFYQIDGVIVGENINLANMKGVLIEFYKKVLGENTEIEFRPSFFPFTEPSVEVHAKFNGLPASAKGSGEARWLEMMGGGMLHPNVLKNAGLDPEKIQGFAFGGGLDRIAMIRWNIPDVRLFYQGDLRLNQF